MDLPYRAPTKLARAKWGSISPQYGGVMHLPYCTHPTILPTMSSVVETLSAFTLYLVLSISIYTQDVA